MTLAGRIRIGMAAKGIRNPTELAGRLKLPRQTVHRWLSGGTMSAEHLFSLAEVLDMSARWLAKREGEPSRGSRLTPDEQRILQLYKALPAPIRESWAKSGDALLTASTTPSVVSPFKR